MPNSDATTETQETAAGKKEWVKPAVAKIEAGEAEALDTTGSDGTFTS